MTIVLTNLTTTLNYYLLHHHLNKKVRLVHPPLVEWYLTTLIGPIRVIRQLKIDKVEWMEPIPLVLPWPNRGH